MNQRYSDTDLMLLRKAVVERFGSPLLTSRDFELLSESIEHSGVGSLSASTLKRIWGYVSDTRGKHLSTLDILARYAGSENGFRDFQQVLASKGSIESGFEESRVLNVCQLDEGTRVAVEWCPDRHVEFRYLGNYEFLVECVRNSKLREGLRVRCARFIEGSSLLLDIEVEAGQEKRLYEAGTLNGITWKIIQ